MAGNKFSKLHLDISQVSNWLNLWCEENIDGDFSITQTDLDKRIQFLVIGSFGQFQIDFIKCTGGVYTISPNVGKDQNLSKTVAEYIYNRLDSSTNSMYANGFSVIISREDFNAVIELLKENGNIVSIYSEQLEPGKAQYLLYHLKGYLKDTVAVKYFLKTSRMQVQGKPLALFNEIVSLVAESNVKPDDVVDSQIELCNISLSRNEVYEEMRLALGDKIYNFLPSSHHAIMAFTFIQFRIDVEFPDYSGIIFPAYRAFEGFVKKVFDKYGLSCTKQIQLGDYFFSKDNTFIMSNEYQKIVNDESIVIFLTRLYGYYNINRHPYAHSSGNDFQTAIITDRKVAKSKFEEIIKKMRSCENYI